MTKDIVDGRKKQLMDLQKGKPYNYMLEHFFPDLRNSVNITLYLHVGEKNCEKQAEAAPSYKAENTESLQTILAKAPADKEIAPPATSTPTTVDVKAGTVHIRQIPSVYTLDTVPRGSPLTD